MAPLPQRDLYAEVHKIAKFLLLAVVLSTVIIVAIYVLQFHSQRFSGDPANWGVLGDYLGGTLGPILNLTTIGILVISINFQRKQIEEGRQDARESKEHAQKQYDALVKQNFEQTFFAWLKSYQDIVSGIITHRPSKASLAAPPVELRGRDALFQIWQKTFTTVGVLQTSGAKLGADHQAIVKNNFENLELGLPFDHSILRTAIRDRYLQFSPNPFYYFGAITRALSQLIEWVGQSDLSIVEKLFYFGIIKSQISDTELSLLFIEGLDEKRENLRAVINQYSLLDGLPQDDWFASLKSSEIPGSYEPSAFDRNVAPDSTT